MIRNCPECSKAFDVLYPDLWRYKREKTYYCSWKCLRATEKPEEKRSDENMDGLRLGNVQHEEAVKVALAGGNPLTYLENLGIMNPSGVWYNIKQKVKAKDPETYAMLPARIQRKDTKKEQKPTLADAMEGMQNAADEFFVKCEDMGLSIHSVETPEDPAPQYKAIVLKSDIQYKIRSIQTDLGTYSADDEYFEFKSAKNKSDAIEMTIEDMVALAKELPDAMRLLGVEI